MSSFFSKTAAIVAHKTLKITASSGDALKKFVADVREDMEVLETNAELKKHAKQFFEDQENQVRDFLNANKS